jgi:hypothetical protein
MGNPEIPRTRARTSDDGLELGSFRVIHAISRQKTLSSSCENTMRPFSHSAPSFINVIIRLVVCAGGPMVCLETLFFHVTAQREYTLKPRCPGSK